MNTHCEFIQPFKIMLTWKNMNFVYKNGSATGTLANFLHAGHVDKTQQQDDLSLCGTPCDYSGTLFYLHFNYVWFSFKH